MGLIDMPCSQELVVQELKRDDMRVEQRYLAPSVNSYTALQRLTLKPCFGMTPACVAALLSLQLLQA